MMEAYLIRLKAKQESYISNIIKKLLINRYFKRVLIIRQPIAWSSILFLFLNLYRLSYTINKINLKTIYRAISL